MMLELFEEDELIDVMTDTFKKRATEIADQASNPRGALGEGADFLRGLDENERQCTVPTRKKSVVCADKR